MNEIGKQAAFYRAYLPHDRSLFPTAVALCAVVTIWLFIYLVSIVGPQQEQRSGGCRSASCGRLGVPTGKPLIMRETSDAVLRAPAFLRAPEAT